VIRTLNRAIEERGIDPFEYTARERRQHPAFEQEEELINSSGFDELIQRYNNNTDDSGKGEEEMKSGDLSALLKETLGRNEPERKNKTAPELPRFFDDIAKLNNTTRQQQREIINSTSPPTSSSSPPTSVEA
jgi:hypothetical protein